MVVLKEIHRERKRDLLEDTFLPKKDWTNFFSGVFEETEGLIQTLQCLGNAATIIDLNGKILFYNDAAEITFGYKLEEVIDKNIVEVLCREADKGFAMGAIRMHAEGKNFSGCLPLVRKCGEAFIACSTCTVIFDSKGNATAVLSLFHDTGVALPSSLSSEGGGSGCLALSGKMTASMPQTTTVGPSFYGRALLVLCSMVSKAMEILKVPLYVLEKDGPTFMNKGIQANSTWFTNFPSGNFSQPKKRLVFQKMLLAQGNPTKQGTCQQQASVSDSEVDDVDAYLSDDSDFVDGNELDSDDDELPAVPPPTSPTRKKEKSLETVLCFLPLAQMLQEYTAFLEGLELKRQLRNSSGNGVESTVFLGSLRGLLVAVKRFRLQDLTADLIVRLADKVALMEVATHPNIVTFLGIFVDAEHFGIVTEYMSRGNLYHLLQRDNNLDLLQRIRIALDIAHAVAYLHRRQPAIIHGSIRSGTVQLDAKYNAKLGNFQCSIVKGHSKLPGKEHGAPQWVAPEVLLGGEADERSDVYSLGVVVWELFTGRIPWEGLNPMQVVAAVAFQHKQLEVPCSLDSRLAAVIRRCLLREPASRPSGSEVAKALQAVLEDYSTARR